MTQTVRIQGPSQLDARLAEGAMGLPGVMANQFGAVAPLLVSAALITTFFAVTQIVAAGAYMLVVALVLAVFSVGFVAMARQVPNTGAFYAILLFGLGRVAGVVGGFVSAASYSMLQLATFGLFGYGMTAFIHVPWWWLALVLWVAVGILGLLEVKISVRVLAVACLLEIAVAVVLSLTGLGRAAHVDWSALSPTALNFGTNPGAGAVMAAVSFVGFEYSAIYVEEARDRVRTIYRATFLTLIIFAVLYTLASLAMVSYWGPDQIAAKSLELGPDAFFTMGTHALAVTGAILLNTSVIAASLSFHLGFNRYVFALGREGVMPAIFGAVRRNGAPYAGSLLQSFIAMVAISVYAVMGWNPLVHMFYFLGTAGGYGMLGVFAVASISVIAYYLRRSNRHGETLWQRFIAPTIAAVALGGFFVLATRHFGTLLGLDDSAPAAVWLPRLIGAVALAGVVWALVLRLNRPDVYRNMLAGTRAAAHRADAR